MLLFLLYMICIAGNTEKMKTARTKITTVNSRIIHSLQKPLLNLTPLNALHLHSSSRLNSLQNQDSNSEKTKIPTNTNTLKLDYSEIITANEIFEELIRSKATHLKPLLLKTIITQTIDYINTLDTQLPNYLLLSLNTDAYAKLKKSLLLQTSIRQDFVVLSKTTSKIISNLMQLYNINLGGLPVAFILATLAADLHSQEARLIVSILTRKGKQKIQYSDI